MKLSNQLRGVRGIRGGTIELRMPKHPREHFMQGFDSFGDILSYDVNFVDSQGMPELLGSFWVKPSFVYLSKFSTDRYSSHSSSSRTLGFSFTRESAEKFSRERAIDFARKVAGEHALVFKNLSGIDTVCYRNGALDFETYELNKGSK